MDKKIQDMFRSEEISVAAAIGARSNDLSVKIADLFSDLIDPLLSKDEVRQLLNVQEADEILISKLDELCRESVLEMSDTTERPLDERTGVRLYRRRLVEHKRLKVIAMESRDQSGNRRYQLALDGRLVRSVAKVHRLSALTGEGNQRAEIRRHVERIAEGISEGNQVPNAILVTINNSMCVIDPEPGDDPPSSFIVIRGISDLVEVPHPLVGSEAVQRLRSVEIDFPFRSAAFDDEKAALLVDGQQRTAALSMVPIDKVPSVTLSIIAFVTDPDEAKKVFQVANTTEKITTEFSRALLASMDKETPGYLRDEQIKAQACRIIGLESINSPFKGLIRYPDPGGGLRNARQVVAYNSIFQVVSRFSDSGLDIESSPQKLAKVVERCFTVISEIWPEAWGKRPSDSRLMHGAGLRSMAALCADLLVAQCRNGATPDSEGTWDSLRESLQRLRATVLWDDSALSGNAAQKKNYREHISGQQNTSQDIAELTKFLMKESLAADQKHKSKK